MSAIGPGDWVECIRLWPGGQRINRIEGGGIAIGGIYQVREVFIGQYADGSPGEGLRFVGIRAFGKNGVEGGWPVEMFRPIYRPKSDFIQSLLKPIKAPAEPEGVDA